MKILFRMTLIILSLIAQSVWASQGYTVIMENLSEQSPYPSPPIYPLPTNYINIYTKNSSCFIKATPSSIALYRHPDPVRIFNMIDDDNALRGCVYKEKSITWDVYYNVRVGSTYTTWPCSVKFRSFPNEIELIPSWSWTVELHNCPGSMIKEATCGGEDCLWRNAPANSDFPAINLKINQKDVYAYPDN